VRNNKYSTEGFDFRNMVEKYLETTGFENLHVLGKFERKPTSAI
jgi:hypothetical protein